MTHLRGLSTQAVDEITQERIRQGQHAAPNWHLDFFADTEPHVQELTRIGESSPPEFYTDLAIVASQLHELFSIETNAGRTKDQVEGKAAILVYDVIKGHRIPIPTLDEPRFWAYLSVAYFWPFAVWRQPQAFDKLARRLGSASDQREADSLGDDGEDTPDESVTYRDYLDGTKSWGCVPLRMYLRIKALGGSDRKGRASAIEKGTDFWQSHVLRIRLGEFPDIVRAMVDLQKTDEAYLTYNPLRRVAKRLSYAAFALDCSTLSTPELQELVWDVWRTECRWEGPPPWTAGSD